MTIWQSRDHYKTLPEWKDKLIFFINWAFYKTFWSDAIFMSNLFGFQLLDNPWKSSIGFPLKWKTDYLWMLKKAGFSYAVISVDKVSWSEQVADYFLWTKSLELSVPLNVYRQLLKEVSALVKKYEIYILAQNWREVEEWASTWESSFASAPKEFLLNKETEKNPEQEIFNEPQNAPLFQEPTRETDKEHLTFPNMAWTTSKQRTAEIENNLDYNLPF